MKNLKASLLLLASLVFLSGTAPAQQPVTSVRAIAPPQNALPSEAQSASVTKFSFIAYGDTRQATDGTVLQPEHSTLVTGMLSAIQGLKNS